MTPTPEALPPLPQIVLDAIDELINAARLDGAAAKLSDTPATIEAQTLLKATVSALLAGKPEYLPVAIKDHEIAALVNKLRDIAKEFHSHDSLRERIAHEVVPALKAPAAGRASIAMGEGEAVASLPLVITDAMHVAACKALLRSPGLAGLPQRMLDAMRATAQPAPAAPAADIDETQIKLMTERGAVAWAGHEAPVAPAVPMSEPMKPTPYNPSVEMREAMKRLDPALTHEQCRALWSAAWSAAQQAPAAPVSDDELPGMWSRSDLVGGATDCNVPDEFTIDLDLLAWEHIKKAAAASNWIPPQYSQNDWVSDVCEFLRERPAPAQPMSEEVRRSYQNLLRMNTPHGFGDRIGPFVKWLHDNGITAHAGEAS